MRNIAVVDGHVYCVSDHLPRDLWQRVLTISAGPQVSEQELMQGIPARPRLKYCIRHGAWIAAVLLPIPWLWLNRHPIRCTADVPG